MTLRELLNKGLVDSQAETLLIYDGQSTVFDTLFELEAEAIEYDFIDESVKNYKKSCGGIIIEM